MPVLVPQVIMPTIQQAPAMPSLNLDVADQRQPSRLPAFWTARRQAARDHFSTFAWPQERDEAWRYTIVDRMSWNDLILGATPESSFVPPPMMPDDQVAGRIVVVNDRLASLRVDANLAKQGVLFVDLQTALTKHTAIVESSFMTKAISSSEGKFQALHGACVSQGAVLYVPRGVTIDKPFEVVTCIDGQDVAIFPHLLLIAEDNASLSFVTRYASAPKATGTSVAAMELFVGRNAQLNFVTMNTWGDGIRHIETQRHVAQADCRVKNLACTLGGFYARLEVEAQIVGSGVRSEMLGLYVANGRQHFDHRTLQDHTIGHSFSDVLYKGALLDNSQTVFSGLINVAPKAQKTDAYQTNRNMVLSDKAQAYTMPKLEIQANDVKCSHGATVGQIAFEHLFYLMSRGIPRAEAERLIVFGFFDEVLGRLPVPVVTEALRDSIGEKILGAEYAQVGLTRKLAG